MSNAELKQLRYARSIIEASLDPLVTISEDGKITDMNKAMMQITGKTREELLHSNFSTYFTDQRMAKKVYQDVFEKGFVVNYPLTITDGSLVDVLFNGSVYKDENGIVIGAVVVARDITEQKKMEIESDLLLAQLREAKLQAELLSKLAETAKTKAEDAMEIAKEAAKSKQQFLSNMSHEIRTPMNAIIGFTKVVLKTELTSKQKEYLNAIKTSGDALVVLINDILDLAKVDAGKMTFEKIPFKIKSSITSMVHLFEPKINEKNIQLHNIYDANIPDFIVGDPIRLHQIILNLVSNAVKFTTSGSITLNTQLIEENDTSVSIQFQVIDTGIGISKQKIESVFELFQQASSSTSRVFGGTGLGLAIVKQLVEAQGGIITVKSEILEGSTFSVLLQFGKTNVTDEEINIPVYAKSNIGKIKVLVVEDIALNQLLMKTVLDEFGFDLEIASNGRIAIEKLAETHFDIILMDLQMPEMNGFEATRYIRSVLKSKIPIIALTADVTTVDVAKCKEVGMNDYLAKPVDEDLLYQKINALLSSHNESIIPKEVEPILKKYTDLNSLTKRTKSNTKLIREMISLYLEQTPPLILMMKESYNAKNWYALHATVHKMIPSFSIMGISDDFENMAKKIQEYAKIQEQQDSIQELVQTLEEVCTQACRELKEELNKLNHEK